ncbi:MAG: hypothetical protein R3345_08765 [Fulvivirga sp.]|nr:hypothetical protein [Fulvivirga sp.]
MHEIEPYYNWLQYYNPAEDELSPYYGKQYNYDLYSDTIYGYYIDPSWDFIGSETLYIKILYADYERQFCIVEFIGEWNDAINNDIMHLKRNIIEHLLRRHINQFILIGENVFNFHGSDDSYYEDWFEDVEDQSVFNRPGWIAALNFADHVASEFQQYNIDNYINMGGTLNIDNWRTLLPVQLYHKVNSLIRNRLDF